MKRQVIEFKIGKDGSYNLLAKEGFQGTSCREQTKDLEMVLNGEKVDDENTDDFYKGDDIDLNLNF